MYNNWKINRGSLLLRSVSQSLSDSLSWPLVRGAPQPTRPTPDEALFASTPPEGSRNAAELRVRCVPSVPLARSRRNRNGAEPRANSTRGKLAVWLPHQCAGAEGEMEEATCTTSRK